MRRMLFSVLAAVVCGWTGPASADLCPKCQNILVTPPAGKCAVCGKETDSGALKLCPKCSSDRRECECCRAKLEGVGSDPAAKSAADKPASEWTPAARPSVDSSLPAKPPEGNPTPEDKPPERLPVEPPANAAPLEKPGATPIEDLPEVKPRAEQPADKQPNPARLDPTKPGTFTSGRWQYRLDITDAGKRSEGRLGWLWYDGKKLPRGEINDYYLTPWGPIYWVDVPKNRWGPHGWMTSPSPQVNRRGRALNSPAVAAKPAAAARLPEQPQLPQKLELTKADSGKRARVRVGNVVVVRLAGNPTTGYQWQAAATNSPALRLAGKPQYTAAARSPGVAGAGGTYTFQFQAMQPGTTTIKLFYSRPWEKNRPPAALFTVAVEVLGQAPAAATSGRAPSGTSRTQTAVGGRWEK
jgi:inhibitor of cysteine peptidase